MKNFQSTTDGVWVEQVAIQLTEEEKQLKTSQKEEEAVEKQALLKRLKKEREQPITSEKSEALTSFYNGIKPTLKETDLYELISCNFSENNTSINSGILNFRLNTEHKQVRFNITNN
jgi:hypothetical protein